LCNRFNVDYLLKKIYQHKCVDFSQYKKSSLIRRINSRIQKVGCHDYSEYIVYLNANPEEYDELINAITVNVTEFFRNQEVFKELKDQVFPEIIKNKRIRKEKNIRVWSAGSSFGEEAYSLAILANEVLGNDMKDFRFRIYGTDIDSNCVLRAKKGLYQKEALRNVNKWQINKFFSENKNGYEISDELKDIVVFKKHDLISDEYLKLMDLVLCRNVLIYFNKSLQELVLSKFYNSLKNSGYLILGKVETLRVFKINKFKVINNRERIYQKLK
jgi:chemotaxis protein methyltransferase CheR